MRNTKSVRAILQHFESTEDAISVVDLVSAFRQDMNKTTVYRILERLAENGALHSFTGQDGNRWYAKCSGCTSEGHVDAHPHFQCSNCGKTECLPVEVPIPTVAKYKIESVELLLIGQCENCLP